MIRQLPHDRLLAPAWLDELCPPPDPAPHNTAPNDTSPATTHTAQQGILRVCATLKDADALPADRLEHAVADLYKQLFELMRSQQHPYLLRIWNGLPGINDGMTAPQDEQHDWDANTPDHEPFDRYMAFNAGRNTAFRGRFGDDDGLAHFTPAATAVGHAGKDLQIHILASNSPGKAIENPRQTPAYHYSQRYGPRPPVFVRATRFGDRLFVSGTASIVGEQSMHPDKLQAQFEETLANLSAITQRPQQADARLHHFRVYAPKADDLPMLADKLQQAYPSLRSIELMRADICRRNLRVEIEAAS